MAVLVSALLAAEGIALDHDSSVGHRAEAVEFYGALECGSAVVLHDLDLGVGRADVGVGAALVDLGAVIEEFAPLAVVPVREHEVIHHGPRQRVCRFEVGAGRARGVEVRCGLLGVAWKPEGGSPVTDVEPSDHGLEEGWLLLVVDVDQPDCLAGISSRARALSDDVV